jgi:hypothetical protein
MPHGWFDTPVHPLIGVSIFIVGFVACMASVLFVAAQLLG